MTESYIFKSNTWSSSITLDKPKVIKGICHAAKLAKYLFLINKSQKPYFFKIVLPRTVADDVSVYRITL